MYGSTGARQAPENNFLESMNQCYVRAGIARPDELGRAPRGSKGAPTERSKVVSTDSSYSEATMAPIAAVIAIYVTLSQDEVNE